MSRVPSPSVPRRSPPRHRHRPNRRLRRWLERALRTLDRALRESADRTQADRYRKHFRAVQHAHFLLCHGLSRSPSLRQSYDTFAHSPALRQLSGLAAGPDPDDAPPAVSFSQLAESNTTRPAAFLAGLVPPLVQRVQALDRVAPSVLPPDLAVLDSTFLRLSLHLAPWLPTPRTPSEIPGLRVQVLYTPALDLPEHVLVTDHRTNDCRGFDQALLDDPPRLATLRHRTLVLDLGYYSHRRLGVLLAAAVHFVTRRHAQATLTVEADRPVQAVLPLPGLDAARLTVTADQRVTVGSATNHAGAVLPGLRLVTATVHPLPPAARQGAQPVVYELLTDRWDLDAAAIVQLYLYRWQIELFFRWLKSHVPLLPWLGHSPNAVHLTLWLALIVHLLSVLAAHALGLARRSPTLLHRLAVTLLQLEGTTPLAPTSIDPPALQLPLPGWDLDPVPIPPF